MARVQFAKATKRAKDDLYSTRACHLNILGALRCLGEQNLTHVSFSIKSLARLAALKYAQTGQGKTFKASTGIAIGKMQKNHFFVNARISLFFKK
jgi:hypothetical protein